MLLGSLLDCNVGGARGTPLSILKALALEVGLSLFLPPLRQTIMVDLPVVLVRRAFEYDLALLKVINWLSCC